MKTLGYAVCATLVKRILLDEGSSPVRVNAARALGTWGTQKSIPALQDAADKDPDSIVRSRAKKAIEAIKLRQGASAMSLETAAPRYETPRPPAETVASKRDTPATPDNASKSPPGPKPPPEFAAIVDDLNSSDFSRRIPATLKLLREKPKEPNLAVAKALERVLLEDGDPPIRDSAARALQNWGTSESIPALQKAAEKDPDSQVRTSAQKAIEAIKAR